MWKIVNGLVCRGSRLTFQLRNMSTIRVKRVPGEERLYINFEHTPKVPEGFPAAGSREYNFERLQTQELEQTLRRIRTNIFGAVQKKFTKWLKKSKTPEKMELLSEPDVKLMQSDGSEVSGDVVNSEAWVEGNELVIDGEKYSIQMNLPDVVKARLPVCIMAGFPTYPLLEMEFADLEKSTFIWFTQRTPEVEETDGTKRKRKRSSSPPLQWFEVSRGYSFTPTEGEVGKKLKVECIPSDGVREGKRYCLESTSEVKAGPGVCPFERRHEFTQKLTGPGSFRVMTYNILADLYADSDFSRDYLFAACPAEYLHIDYRKMLLTREILGYNADVICLQEVDRKVFTKDFQPIFKAQGLEGFLKLKNGELGEGSATFYRKSKFKCISQHDIDLKESLQTEPENKDLLDKILSNEALKAKVIGRKTSLQLTLLESRDDPSRKLLVACTHLYFHPKSNNIRIIQSVICMRHIQRVVNECTAQGFHPSLVFCGDFNNTKFTGVETYLSSGKISSKHADWYCGGKEEFVPDMNFEHNFNLTSACGYPDYTNYVPGFRGGIDYIFIQREKFDVQQVVPMPTHDEVVEHIALPNVVFPSDHLALVCDLAWKDKMELES